MAESASDMWALHRWELSDYESRRSTKWLNVIAWVNTPLVALSVFVLIPVGTVFAWPVFWVSFALSVMLLVKEVPFRLKHHRFLRAYDEQSRREADLG